ncbi:MAG TPA: carboxymuconolactone decarboxylase family protein [Gemmatimonadaceae bacterium]|nr:carboxymuconolactone decarboxylase family protein [Gemmatimonadaceae bacterium]
MSRNSAPQGDASMRELAANDITVGGLDAATRELVELSIMIATARETELRTAMRRAASTSVNPEWVEELILQSYIFAGFPRALNAAREWRRASGIPAPRSDSDSSGDRYESWRARGEATCATVYGAAYDRLRANIRELHPALDEWMIVEGYGKLLGRPGLDLSRRELCIVAVCGVLEQERQLHAHLHGALNAGASAAAIQDTLDIVAEHVDAEAAHRFTHLWNRVRTL